MVAVERWVLDVDCSQLFAFSPCSLPSHGCPYRPGNSLLVSFENFASVPFSILVFLRVVF